jgi:uncharacterized protein YbbC (DUF1343 family)
MKFFTGEKILAVVVCTLIILPVIAQTKNTETRIIPGAERLNVYLPYLKNKTVAVFANQTSMVGNKTLIDTLKKLAVNIKIIFAPEHGFRGDAGAGEVVGDGTDKITGIKVISLYGNKTKPSAEDLQGINMMIFDIQDVGVRFYTYISSLQKYMEAAFENGIPLIILDRPDPNGFYVDGPVLDTVFRSFVGMQPVPVVYGMTIGEYAFMIAGERWLSSKKANDKYDYYRNVHANVDTPIHFLVVKCANYTHQSKYVLPVKPSPGLPFMSSVYHYPSTCFFEGTVLSEGRGTDFPFEIFGHPLFSKTLFQFIPHENNVVKDPKFNKQICYGWNIVLQKNEAKIELKWLLDAYKLFPDKNNFFLKPEKKNATFKDYFFNLLAGNDELMQQIIEGKTEDEIRKSWQPKLDAFKKIRKKYLLYAE